MKKPLPPSETSLATNLLGYGTALAAVYLLRDSGLSQLDMAIAILCIGALPVLLIEGFFFKRHREPYAQLGSRRAPNLKRVLTKTLGLYVVLACFGALYAMLPEYDKPFYVNVWPFYMGMAPFILLAAPFYLAWCDARMDTPEDSYYQLGRLCLGKAAGIQQGEIARTYRNWLVKAFFLPIMFTNLVGYIYNLQTTPLKPEPTFIELFLLAQLLIMFADLLYAVLGYILTMRIFNAHIRSSEPTCLGWVVTVICYYPIWNMFYNAYFNYNDGAGWSDILPPGIVQYIWGVTILLLIGTYGLTTVCLGIRFSNLTYRGLVTNGPYRFTKHPGYVAKNLSWWMLAIPFISDESTLTILSHCFALLCINGIYFLRARTEERHLSNYPEYVEYGLIMNERSIFAPLAKRLPFLKYDPENRSRI